MKKPSTNTRWRAGGGRGLALALTLGSILASEAQARASATQPREGDEHVLLRTTRGDLVIALFPDVAPKHVAQIVKLVRMGVYDSTWFHRVEPGFVVQLSDAQNRKMPLTSEQSSAIEKLPLELSPVPHQLGVVSMARRDGDLNSAETSFSLLLAAAPHLDGKYTIFGRLIWGDDVLAAIASAPRDRQNKPLQDILVQAALIKTGAEIDQMKAAGELRKAADVQSVPGPAASSGSESSPAPQSPVVSVGLVLMMTLSLVAFFLAGRLPPHRVSAFNILVILVGAFLLLRNWVPQVRGRGLWALLLFFGTVALFKLMNRFESLPRPRSPADPPAASERPVDAGDPGSPQ